MKPDADGEVLDQVEELLLSHPESDPITSAEIGDALDLHDTEGNPDARRLIREAIDERNLPVAAGPKGYYYLSDSDALSDYLDRLDGRIAGIQERKQLVAAAWNRRHSGRVTDGESA